VVGTVAEILVAMLDQALLTTLVAATTTTTAMIVSQHLHLHLHLRLHQLPTIPTRMPSLYGDGGYQQEYSGSNYGGSSNNSVFDADMLSKVTRGLGTPTTWVGNNTQEAINANPNSRYDFDLADAYETEKTGALPVDGSSSKATP
jgi:hypothetical protein